MQWLDESSKALIENMPLVESLKQIAGQQRTSWHTPGHAGGKGFPDWLRDLFVSADLTELPVTDDLNRPAGVALEAMKMAANAFGSGLTRFITGGSTTGLHILLAMAVGYGGKLLLPRCVHQSVVHIAALMAIDLRWIAAGAYSRFGLLPQVTPQSVAAALEANPDSQVVLVTSPDYYGTCADIPTIAEVVHQYGGLLLVDEAHGAHFAFSSDLPPSAMCAGADACVQSGHKTLPVLTPGAYLHISAAALQSGRLSADRLEQMLPIFQTSSPSFPVAASLDYARAWLEHTGEFAITRQLDNLMDFRSRLSEKFICSPLSMKPDPGSSLFRDPLRVVVCLDGNISRPTASDLLMNLSAEGIDLEFADRRRMVLIPSLLQTEQAWQQLAVALNRLLPEKGGFGLVGDDDLMDGTWRSLMATVPEPILHSGEVLFGRHQQIRVDPAGAVGRISARLVAPYPPGVPLVWPGERLDKNRVDFLVRLMENNASISGLDQQGFWVLA
ncbi:MAG: aminotransferase class I/II-fold pyridoxal phosphate-dependent enzyme [Saccharofermentanales bacterium]|jgi:arginine/lysine/ornithine decarboxylase|nr:aminotransferase class I/II-fold pyridoxal phosphate-dependent enzyme [Clostridiaceae bacterium]